MVQASSFLAPPPFPGQLTLGHLLGVVYPIRRQLPRERRSGGSRKLIHARSSASVSAAHSFLQFESEYASLSPLVSALDRLFDWLPTHHYFFSKRY